MKILSCNKYLILENIKKGSGNLNWITPSGISYNSYAKMLDCNHLLIAGCSGSGKSVVMRGILREIMQCYAPSQKQIILLDPKRVDFNEFKNIPHIMKYANEYKDMVFCLDYALDIMEKRYKEMERRKLKLYDGCDIYVMIDEYADLHDIGGKEIESKVIRLCQLARASRIHVIISTQRAISCVSTRIRANLECRLALHTINKKESINIIDIAGAESLPLNGYGIFQNVSDFSKISLPFVKTKDTDVLIDYWTSKRCKSY